MANDSSHQEKPAAQDQAAAALARDGQINPQPAGDGGLGISDPGPIRVTITITMGS